MNTKQEQEIIAAVDGKGSTRHALIGVIGDIAILKAWLRIPLKDAPFTGAVCRDGVWRGTSNYSRSQDAAILETIGNKYDSNSRFGIFTARMLGIQP
jgi:hypothetical protein